MKYQQGSTLIMVLIVLLLITIIGTVAMRESLLNLRLSTSNQISNLLMKNTDSAVFELENPDITIIEESISQAGMYGYLTNKANAEEEIAFCFNSKNSSLFAGSFGSIKPDGTLNRQTGFCVNDVFSSSRDNVISQVYLKKSVTDIKGSALPQGSSQGVANEVPIFREQFVAAVISILPGITSVADDKIDACFKKPSASTTGVETVDQCFKDLGVPYNIQFSEIYVTNDKSSFSS